MPHKMFSAPKNLIFVSNHRI